MNIISPGSFPSSHLGVLPTLFCLFLDRGEVTAVLYLVPGFRNLTKPGPLEGSTACPHQKCQMHRRPYVWEAVIVIPSRSCPNSCDRKGWVQAPGHTTVLQSWRTKLINFPAAHAYVDGCVVFDLLLESENTKNNPLPPKKSRNKGKCQVFSTNSSPQIYSLFYSFTLLSHIQCVHLLLGPSQIPCLNSRSSLPSFPERRPKKIWTSQRTTYKMRNLKLCLYNSFHGKFQLFKTKEQDNYF